MFSLYELAGVFTNIVAGLAGARWGIRSTLARPLPAPRHFPAAPLSGLAGTRCGVRSTLARHFLYYFAPLLPTPPFLRHSARSHFPRATVPAPLSGLAGARWGIRSTLARPRHFTRATPTPLPAAPPLL